MIATVAHPSAGALDIVASPIRMSDTPVTTPVAPPRLGEHTDEVLTELLGFDAARLGALRKGGVIA
jgi:formyl-CoA transferase